MYTFFNTQKKDLISFFDSFFLSSVVDLLPSLLFKDPYMTRVELQESVVNS